VDLAEAEALIEDMHDWPATWLVEVYRRVRGLTWGERAIRAEADLRELVAEGVTPALLQACVEDGWFEGSVLSRLDQRRHRARYEAIMALPQIGIASAPIREGPVLRSLATMAARRVPHDVGGLPVADAPTYAVPGPFASEQADAAERARLERERDLEPLAQRYARDRLRTYHQCYVELVEARMSNIVDFALGRFTEGDNSHGTSRRRRPAERQSFIEGAHEAAHKHGDGVRRALLALGLERLHRDREFWAEQSCDRQTRAVFTDACLPLSVELVRLIEDAGLEARPLVGCVDHLGTTEACCIVNSARWERGPTAPLRELWRLKDAAACVRQGDLALAMSSGKVEDWLQGER